MHVTILYFSHLRSALGRGKEVVGVATGARVEDVVSLLATRYDEVARMRSALRFAVGTSFVDDSHVLSDRDELALLTPVSGG